MKNGGSAGLNTDLRRGRKCVNREMVVRVCFGQAPLEKFPSK
jgi:hypothetical protein